MQPEGTGTNGVLFVSDTLGPKEVAEGLPLRPNAPGGAILAGILRRISGQERSHFLFSNTLWCQPGSSNWIDGAPYEYASIEHCQQYNRDLIARRRPRAIVALGAVPTRTITGLHGYNQGIKLLRGYQIFAARPEYFVDGRPLPVIPTYNPLYLLRGSKTRSRDLEGKSGSGEGGKVEKAEGGMGLAGVVTRDIQQALAIAAAGPLVKPQMECIKGNREVMDNLIRDYDNHPEWPLYWDIETPRSIDKADDESEIDSIQAQVTQIQFGHNKERGYVFPGFDALYVKEGTRRLLAARNRRMLTWNGWKFDNKVVMGHHGIPILGIDIDLMSAWAWLQPDLPRGLQYATSFFAPEIGPWKHLAFDSEDIYGMYDVISLAYNDEGIFEALDKRGLRNSYDRHVLMLRPEMVLASHRGFPVDKEKHDEFGTKIKVDIDVIAAKIQSLIPEEVLRWGTKSKNGPGAEGYSRTPTELAEHLDSEGNPRDGGDRISIVDQIPVEDDDGNETEELETRTVVYARRTVEVLNKKSLDMERVPRWGRYKPFSVGSGDQKIAYINFRRNQEINERMAKGQDRDKAERLAKYKVPKVKNKMKELKDNTGAKELEKLFKETGDEVFKLLVEISKLKKLYGTYYKGWHVVDGGVHTTFGLANTGTGQLSSVDPNIQNAPKHGDLAKVFRTCVRALPNKMLVEIDKKSFHAQTLALAARDKAYARLSAIDVHSFMTCHRLRLPEAKNLLSWSDKDMMGYFDMMKADTKTIYKAEAVPNIPDGLTFQQVRDYKSKKVILGIGFCQGAASILEQNPEGYKDKKEVQTFIDLFGELFSDVKRFQGETTQLAHKQTYLISKWGYIRRFYDVFKWNSRKWNTFTGSMGDWEHGDEFEAAVAFLPANHAFGMIKEEMLRLAGYRLPEDYRMFPAEDMDGGAGEYQKSLMIKFKHEKDLFAKYGFVNQIHDAILYHCDKSLVDKCLEDSMRIMREPCLVLADEVMCPNGFFVDAEAMVGPDWAHMSKIKGI